MPQEGGNQDLKGLIASAAQPDEQQPSRGGEAAATGQGGANELASSLAELMQADPVLAGKIADLIEQHFGGGEQVQGVEGIPAAPAAPDTGAAASPGAAQVPPQPVAVPVADQQVPQELLQRLAALEQAVSQMQRPLADYQLDRELAQLRQRYDQLRRHYGDVLPEKFDELEKPVLEKYAAILEGKVPPHELALLAALSETLHGGDTPLRDRLLAAAAKQAQQAPPVEGRGGMAAAAEEKPPVPRTTAERMERLKELWRTLNQTPGA